MSWNRAEPAVPHNADDWFTPGRFAILLAVLTFAAYPEVVLGSRTFFHRDYAVFGYPLASYLRDCYWRGEMPLWNPYNDCGLPFLAQWNSMTLYPLSLFYVLLPLSWSLGVFNLGHFFLAGLGMYFLVHRWTGNRYAAAVGGVAFTFNAMLLNFLMWPNNLAAIGWLPWVVLAAERAWQQGGRWLLLAALAGAMQMLTGAPEVILLTWILLASLAAGQLILTPRRWWEIGRRFAGMGLWVAALTAAQLLPFLDLLAHSQRHKEFGDSMWSMPLWGWANFLVPLFRNYPTSLGVYAQPDQYWVSSYYMGVGVVVFALLGAVDMRRPRAWLLGGLSMLCLVLALGQNGHVYPALKKVVPGLGFMRYPIKFVMLPTVLIPLLASFWVARWLGAPEPELSRQRRRLMLAGAGALVAIGLVAWAAFRFPLRGTSAALAGESAWTRAVFLVLILGGFIGLRRIASAQIQVFARLGLLLCLWLDVLTAGPRPNPTVLPSAYEPNVARRELHLVPEPALGQTRAMLNAETEGNLVVAALTNALDQVLYSRLALVADINLLDNIPKVVGMYSLYIRETGEVLSRLWTTTNPPAGLMDFLSVAHVNTPGKATQWDSRPTHLPWVTGGQAPVFADRAGALTMLESPGFDPRRAVVLPPEVRGQINVSNRSSPRISMRSFTANKIEMEAEATEAAFVVIAQSYYHNWHAYLGKERAPLFRANHAFQAVQVPAGHHEIKLIYQDRAFHFGAIISAISVVSWLTLWQRERRRRAAVQTP